MSQHYWLARHCYLCLVGDELILMNAKTGTMYVQRSLDSGAVGRLVPGWPVACSQENDFDSQVEDVTADLLRQGVLVKNRKNGKDARPASLPPRHSALLNGYERVPTQVTWKDAGYFLLSALAALWQRGSMLQVMHRRRQRRTTKEEGEMHIQAEEFTEEVLREWRRLLSTFELLWPWLPRTHRRRLVEKLALLKFFELHGWRPSLVFAISRNPFTQGLWLQCGNVVIDEPPDVVATLAPAIIA